MKKKFKIAYFLMIYVKFAMYTFLAPFKHYSRDNGFVKNLKIVTLLGVWFKNEIEIQALLLLCLLHYLTRELLIHLVNPAQSHNIQQLN